MPDLTDQTEQMFSYFISGLIINDPNGPRCYGEWIDAPSPLRADEIAREEVANMRAEGLHGILFIANVLQIAPLPDGNIGLVCCDKDYAVYGDDPRRLNGVSPEGGWTPPKGYEGRDIDTWRARLGRFK